VGYRFQLEASLTGLRLAKSLLVWTLLKKLKKKWQTCNAIKWQKNPHKSEKIGKTLGIK